MTLCPFQDRSVTKPYAPFSPGSYPPAGPGSDAPCCPHPTQELKARAWAFPAPISLQPQHRRVPSPRVPGRVGAPTCGQGRQLPKEGEGSALLPSESRPPCGYRSPGRLWPWRPPPTPAGAAQDTLPGAPGGHRVEIPSVTSTCSPRPHRLVGPAPPRLAPPSPHPL